MELKTTVYQKENNIKIGKLLNESLNDIFSSRFLAKQLAIRDIKAQYRQSYLGIIWAFLTPLTTALFLVNREQLYLVILEFLILCTSFQELCCGQ
jgi:lipopolysaccharide transport system permease protein